MLHFFDCMQILISAFFIYFGYALYKFFTCQRLSPDNKAIFITGCDTGFGFLLAKRMAELQYRVFAGCLLPEGDGARALQSFSSKIEVLSLDVTKEQSVKEAAKIVEASLGIKEVLWAIVNNAGIGHCGEIEWSPIEAVLKVFDVNTFGMVRVTQSFLPLLRKSKGRIVNMTSIAAVKTFPSGTIYCMSKYASSAFSDGIRFEMKKWKIKVINMQPHFYRTSLTNPNNVTTDFRNAWENADPNTAAILGKEYFKKYYDQCKKSVNILANKNLEDVIQCLEEALTSPKPKLYYQPGNLKCKLLLVVGQLLPVSLMDYIQSAIFPSLPE